MELTTEQKDIIKAAREFAEKEFRDRAKEFDEKEEFDLSIWKRAASCWSRVLVRKACRMVRSVALR